MKGSLQKRGLRWHVRLDLDAINGGRCQRRVTFDRSIKTKKAAEVELARILTEIHTGDFVAPANLSVRTLLVEHWLPHARTNVAGKTFQRYAEVVEKKLIPAFGGVQVSKLQPGQVQQAYDAWINAGLSPQTVKHHHAVLRNALRYAVRMGLVNHDVTQRVKPPAGSSPEMTALDESQSLVLLGMSKGKDIETLVTVALFSGLRRGELLALRWCDVDFADETLHVRQALEETRGEKQPGKQYRTTVLQFKEPKTRKSRRAVALDAATIRMLKRQRAQQNAHRLAFGEAYRADLDLVFCAEDGSPFKPDTITKRFASLVKAAPIPHLRFHDLRHSHATQLLRAGVHFKIVSERLGHASVAITLDRYSHVLPGMDRQALEALTRLYASAAS